MPDCQLGWQHQVVACLPLSVSVSAKPSGLLSVRGTHVLPHQPCDERLEEVSECILWQERKPNGRQREALLTVRPPRSRA